jgi:hypothetical protein
MENDAHPFAVRWESNAERDVFVGSHDGYRRLADPVVHTRTIRFDKQRLIWTVEDLVDGRGTHLVEVFLHPGVPIEREKDAVRLRAPRGDLLVFGPQDASMQERHGWISAGYGMRRPAPVLVYAVRASVPIQLRTDLVLVAAGTSTADARSLLD